MTESKTNDIYALFTIYRADGSMIIREHIENVKRIGEEAEFSQIIEVRCV